MNALSNEPAMKTGTGTTRIWVVIGVITLCVMFFLLANAHLVYVAVTSQPDCVAHVKATDSVSGSFRAAKSAC